MRRVVIVVGACSVVLIAFLVAVWIRASSIEAFAQSSMNCLEQFDADCLYDRMTIEEREAYELSREEFGKFMKEYIALHLAHGRKEVAIVETLQDQGTANVRQRWELSEGKSTTITLTAVMADDGYLLKNVVGQLVSLVGNTRYTVSDGNVPSLDRLRAWARIAREDGDFLESCGVRGMYRDQREGVLPWDDWAAYLESRIQAAESANSDGSTTRD